MYIVKCSKFSCIPMEHSIDYCFLYMQRCILWQLWPMCISAYLGANIFAHASDRMIFRNPCMSPPLAPLSGFATMLQRLGIWWGRCYWRYLPVKAGGFIQALALRTFGFAQNKFKDQLHIGEDPVSHRALELPDDRNSVSKKVGPAVISSDLSPTGS